MLSLYKQSAQQIIEHSAPVLNEHRAYYADLLERKGLPTRHTEDYRYTDLQSPLAIDYGVNVRRLSLPQNKQTMCCDVPGMQSLLCWVVNGEIIMPKEIADLNITIKPLSQCADLHTDIINTEDPLVALNGMFAQEGLYINIPDGVTLSRPIQIMNISNADLDLFTAMHHIIRVGRHAKAQILFCDHATAQHHYLQSSTTEVHVGEDAVYEHYHLEDSSATTCRLNNLIINQSARSQSLVNMVTLRNGTTRNNTIINQQAADCQTQLCGMFIGKDCQTTDNYTRVNHCSTGGKSNELFKYVLDDNSRGVFKGELYVAPHAQKTEAYQTNRNILLSPTAQVRTEPQLLIYADDVRCSHGATTGQLDDAALFYMQQRGIPYAEARLLLMNAFVADVISNIRIDALQDRIRTLTDHRLRNDASASPCHTCRSAK